jgi:ABC-2 type transport system permease protein
MTEIFAILAIAYRDFTKYIKDRPRIISSIIFPLVFISALGGSLQSNLGSSAGYNLVAFTFTGVLAQTLFQTVTQGVISLTNDRETNLTQEIMVAPISRYSIILGKIIGESTVAIVQGLFVVFLGLVMGVRFSAFQLLTFIPVFIMICLLGGAFGVLIASMFNSSQNANRLFPLLIFPQFFLAGVFSPIKELPLYLLIPSRIAPMTYAVDFLRGVFYWGSPEAEKIVLFNPFISFGLMVLLFILFMIGGTYLFVKTETER